MSIPIKVILVTSNAGKVNEISRALLTRQAAAASSSSTTTSSSNNNNNHNATTIQVEAQNLDLPELQGEPEQVAEQKCKEARKLLKGTDKENSIIMVEDTSLCFNALNGLPGVFVKWFLDKTGREGLIKLLHPYHDKTAYAQCIFAVSLPSFTDNNNNNTNTNEIKLFTGRTHGIIVDSPRGPKDSFGWDPIFQPNESSGDAKKTYAEMSKDEKNLISHRGKALNLVIEFLEKLTSTTTIAAAALPSEKKQKLESS
jgi:inosine triphosphate pyrophosphatase